MKLVNTGVSVVRVSWN